jgi:4-amino-4-deoxy-L-arabinose transferase-like glycosyltransferase
LLEGIQSVLFSHQQALTINMPSNAQESNNIVLLFITKHPAFTLACYFLLVFGINLFFPRDLWVQDEMRYGEVVREILTEGHWLIPHLNGYPYPDKPPLYFLLVAGLSLLTDNITFSFRLLTFISTALCVYGIYLLGKMLVDVRTGFWSGLLFCSTLLSLIVGHIVRMDMLLTATTIFALITLLQYQRSQQLKHLLLFWFVCTAGVAVKGPIALLFTALPALAWVFWLDQWSGIKKLRLLSGFAMLFSIIGLWLLAVILNGEQSYLLTIWHEQIVGRTIKSWSHREPVYFYVLLLPILLMPWSILVLHGLNSIRKQNNSLLQSELYAVLFFVFMPLLAISLVSGKLFIYLEPLVPACCLAAAWSLNRLSKQSRTPYWLSTPPIIYYTLMSGACYYIALQHFAINTFALKAIAVTIAALGFIQLLSLKLTLNSWLKTTLLNNILFSILVFGTASSVINPLFSGSAVVKAMEGVLTNESPIAVVNTTRGILNFYVNKTFDELSLSQADKWFSQHQHATIIIKTKDITKAFPDRNLMQTCKVNNVFEVELKEYHVFSQC